MGELMGYVDQITSYGFSSTDLGNKAVATVTPGNWLITRPITREYPTGAGQMLCAYRPDPDWPARHEWPTVPGQVDR